MKTHLLSLFLILPLLPAITTPAQPFSGQVFVMTENLSIDRCQPQIECDCCSSDIFFLTDNQFVMVDKCIHNDSYWRGTYTTDNTYLTLTFDQFVIRERTDDDTEETRIEKQNLTVTPVRFLISTCSAGNLTLQRTDLKVLTIAFKVSEENAAAKITRLKSSNAWEQLQ